MAEIREATEGDLAALIRLINRAYLVEAFFVRGDRIDRSQIDERKVAGDFLVVGPAGGPLEGAVHVEIDGERGAFGLLSVDPDLQGQGLGRVLVAAAEERCRRAGCRTIELWVVDLRAELRGWYQRLGYQDVRTEPFRDRDRMLRPCHFVVMRKPLQRKR